VNGFVKIAHVAQVSAEALATNIAQSIHACMDATPEQRAAWVREATEHRATERAAAPVVEPTRDALLAKLGWGPRYAEHVVQTYCECGDDIDGWSRCLHATDLGLETWQ